MDFALIGLLCALIVGVALMRIRYLERTWKQEVMLYVIAGCTVLGQTAFATFLIGRGYCWEAGIVDLAAGMIIGCLVTLWSIKSTVTPAARRS